MNNPSDNPLIRKLERFGFLTDEERQVLKDAIARVRDYRPREDIVREGDAPSESCIILQGFACRYNQLPDGQRQITAFHIPGDFADLHSFLLKKMDDGVMALTPCKVALVPHQALKEITKNYPWLTRVLWFTTLVDGAIHREWMTTLGRMEARERIAHFICEMRLRLQTIGLTTDDSYEQPINQTAIGDAFGVSTVHTNRVLQDLRADGLITSEGKTLIINDWERLQQVAQFQSDYLHSDQQIERD